MKGKPLTSSRLPGAALTHVATLVILFILEIHTKHKHAGPLVEGFFLVFFGLGPTEDTWVLPLPLYFAHFICLGEKFLIYLLCL